MLCGIPGKDAIDRWRRDAHVRRTTPAPAEATEVDAEAAMSRWMLDLPEGWDWKGVDGSKTDPVKLLHGLNFAKYLRRTAEFSEAGQAWEDYTANKEADDPRPRNADARPTTWFTAGERLDFATMLLQRRENAALLELNHIRAMTVMSDASPVTGVELQALILVMHLENGDRRMCTMPGASLSYGHYDSLSKTGSLLYALWLLFGPTKASLRKALRLVRCVTTDFGVESKTLETPDIVDAFFSKLMGRPDDEARALVNYSNRLFPVALRLRGWSHFLGSVMKTVAKS